MTTYTETLEKACKWASIEFDRLITVQSIRAQTKALAHGRPRFFAMAYMHATGRYSLPQIAHALKLSNHTSVLYGLRRAHGHDGKGPAASREPLWNKEQFENMVRQDYPAKVITVETWHEQSPESLKAYVNGKGWL